VYINIWDGSCSTGGGALKMQDLKMTDLDISKLANKATVN